MQDRKAIQTTIDACRDAADRLIEAAKAVLKPGSYHIAYHLATLALEEIGKASMLFIDSLPSRLRDPNDEEHKLAESIDDHEQKLFWAIWLPISRQNADWRTIPSTMKLAREIHQTRLDTLYVDPADLDAAASIAEGDVNKIIDLAEARLAMERAATFRDVPEDDQEELEWFFEATRDPKFAPFIFSKGSLDKHKELQGDPLKWIGWLRQTLDEAERTNNQLTLDEMNRAVPTGDAAQEDKFRVTIRLVSWSHSIRQNQLNKWNEGVDRLKLTAVQGKQKELIVQFTMPKLVQGQAIYTVGYQNCLLFVAALNMATMGFFWWYVPKFVSRYYERIQDLEAKADVFADREPKLEPDWGHLAMKEGDYNNLGQVWTLLMASIADPKKAAFIQRYITVLSVMAKNDIFGQFEPQCLIELLNALRAGLFAFGDWDGTEETIDTAIEKFFRRGPRGDELLAFVNEPFQLVKEIVSKGVLRPVTVEEVIKAKIVVDTYVNIKIRELMPSIVSDFRERAEAKSADVGRS